MRLMVVEVTGVRGVTHQKGARISDIAPEWVEV